MPEAPPETSILYRAVGSQELSRIKLRGWTSFATMPDQPTFDAFTTEAAALAHAANVIGIPTDANPIFMLRFAVRAGFLAPDNPASPASGAPTAYAIPAAELPALNDNITGEIEIIAEHRNGSAGSH